MFQKLFYLNLFIFLSNSITQSNNIFIKEIYGTLKEYEKNQLLSIIFSETIDINDLTYFEFVKGTETYSLKPDCYNNLNLNNYLVNCDFNLKKLSFGNYKLKSFFYKNNKINSDKTIEILENEYKNVSNIKLNDFSGYIKEYKESQYFKLYFSENLRIPSRLIRMKIINEKNKKFSINLYCNSEEYSSTSLNCVYDFFLKIGKYQIINLLYYNDDYYEVINTSKNLTFLINKDILTLKFISGEAHNEKFNLLNLRFKEDTDPKYFSKFFIRNVNNFKDYVLDYKFIDIIKDKTLNSIIFDFNNIPIGEYYINFEYKRHIHINDIKFEIKEVEKNEVFYDDE